MLPALLVMALALPLAGPALQADPGCLGGSACSVPGSGLTGFLPPAAIVASGGRITWGSLDGLPHVNEEGLASALEAPCFSAVIGAGSDDSAVFRLAAGSVTAEGSDGVERPCGSAVVVGGVGVVGYRCIIHPLTMKGLVVVVP